MRIHFASLQANGGGRRRGALARRYPTASATPRLSDQAGFLRRHWLHSQTVHHGLGRRELGIEVQVRVDIRRG